MFTLNSLYDFTFYGFTERNFVKKGAISIKYSLFNQSFLFIKRKTRTQQNMRFTRVFLHKSKHTMDCVNIYTSLTVHSKKNRVARARSAVLI